MAGQVMAEDISDLQSCSASDINLTGKIRGDSMQDSICRIAAGLDKSNTLTSLNLSFNEIDAQGAGRIAAALQTNESLTSLLLGGNSIGPEGTEFIATALEQNTALTSLNLHSNKIGLQGAERIATALKKNRTLAELNLCNNQLGDSDAECVASALEQIGRTFLGKLDLRSNQIDAAGVERLAASLRQNTSMKCLNLQQNQIGSAGARMLGEALEDNKSLVCLDLGSNQIHEGAEGVVAALERGQLMSLDLTGNDVGKELKARMSAAYNRTKIVSLDFSEADGSVATCTCSNPLTGSKLAAFRVALAETLGSLAHRIFDELHFRGELKLMADGNILECPVNTPISEILA